MIVAKKSGKEELFDEGKVYQSIISANDETNEEINTSDMKVIMSELRHILEGKDRISTLSIDIIVEGLLYINGLRKTLEMYNTYRNKR